MRPWGMGQNWKLTILDYYLSVRQLGRRESVHHDAALQDSTMRAVRGRKVIRKLDGMNGMRKMTKDGMKMKDGAGRPARCVRRFSGSQE